MTHKINQRKIELCKQYKVIVRKISVSLEKDYQSGKLTYTEYFFKLSKALKGRTPESWISYYDNLIYKLSNNEKISHIIPPKGIRQYFNFTEHILLVVVITLILSSALLLGNSSITGSAIFDVFKQPLIDLASNSYTQDQELLFAVNPTSAGVYKGVYILNQQGVYDSIVLDCTTLICYDTILVHKDISQYAPGDYEIAVFDYNKNDYVRAKFAVGGQSVGAQKNLISHDFICHKCSPHKVPPLTNVQVVLETNNPGGYTTISDYFPPEWDIINASNGYIVRYNSTHNKISWDVETNESKLTYSYSLSSPDITYPPTEYYFIGEINGIKDEPWQVIVADPPPVARYNVSISALYDFQVINQRKMFNVTSKVTCKGSAQNPCSETFATVRFNKTGAFPTMPINATNGEKPISISNSRYVRLIQNLTYKYSTGDDAARDIVLDSNNMYVIGYQNNADWQIMKINLTGKSIWNRTYALSSSTDHAYSAAIDSSQTYIYVAGYQSDADQNWRIMKIDINGISIWNRTYNSGLSDQARQIRIDKNNNLYAVGNQNNADWRIMKLNSNGDSIWNKTYPLSLGFPDQANAVAIDRNNDIVVAGTDNADWRIMKLDSNGVSIWNRTFNLASVDMAYGVGIDSYNNIYVVGQIGGVTNDWGVMKLDSNGISIWNRTYNPAGGSDRAQGIFVDINNNLYVFGYHIAADADWRIMKLDINGNSIWNRSRSIGVTDNIYSIASDSSNLYAVGQFGITSLDNDWRIMKIDNSLSYQTCGALTMDQSCSFDWQVNGTASGAYRIGVYYNSSTAGLFNVTENRTVIVQSTTSTSTTSSTTSTTTTTIIGLLNVSISSPKDFEKVNKSKIFNITSKVTCLRGNCNDVFATPRFNFTTLFPNMPINSTYNALPMFVSSSRYVRSIWNRTYNPGNGDQFNSVAMDSNNNVYAVGWLGGVSWIIMKFNSLGVNIWNRTFAPTGFDLAYNIAIDENDYLYVVGSQNSGTSDWFIMKLDSNGASIWNKTIVSGGSDTARAVVIDKFNGVYIVGSQGNLNADWRIMKLDSNGLSIWNRTYNLGGSESARDIVTDKNNNIYVAGDKGAATTDWFIMKLDSNGFSFWNRSYNPGGTDQAYAISIDQFSNIYVAGIQSNVDQDWRIMKLDSNGFSLWNKTFVFAGTDNAYSIAYHNNYVYVTGDVFGAINWKVIKLSSSGISLWNKTYNPGVVDSARGIAISNSNNIYVVGNEGNANQDLRIMRLDANLNLQSCGSLFIGQSCLFDWQINATLAGAYKIGVYYNTTLAFNVTENRTVIVQSTTSTSTTSTTTSTSTSTILGTLNVSISKPNNLELVNIRRMFNITSKVTCLVNNCDAVYATPRFNYSSIYPFTPINSTNGEIPLSIAISRYTMSIWNRTYNPGSTDVPRAITIDSSNNIYTVGQTGVADWFIAKLSSNGDSIWNRTYNPGATDVAYGVTIDSSNNLYAVGYTNGADWFIAKLSSNGDSIWNRTYNPGGTDTAQGVTIDSSNNIYAVGRQGDADGNWRIQKIDSNGNSIWNRTYNPGATDTAQGVTIDSSNNIYVVGYQSDVNWRIQKIDSNGNSIWNRTYNPGGTDTAHGVTIDSSNNIYAVGRQSDADGNWRIQKIDSDGNSIWDRTYNPGATDVAYGVTIDSSNNIYIVGQQTDTDNNWRIMKLDNSLSYQLCGFLTINQQCIFDWQVNATKLGSYSIGVYYNSTGKFNVTENRTIIVGTGSTTTSTTTTIDPSPYFVNITNDNRDIYHINDTTPAPGQLINLSLVIIDNIDISHYLLSTNNTGIWANYTWLQLAGTQTSKANWTRIIANSTKLDKYGWRFYANDSQGQLNKSSINTFSTVLGTLNLSTLFQPVNLSSINSKKTFNLTLKVTCQTDNCKEVFATARFNRTGLIPNAIINSTNGMKPLSVAVSRYSKNVWNRTLQVGNSMMFGITIDQNSNIYTVGTNLTGFSQSDWLIMKLNSTGASIWNRSFNPGVFDKANAISIDSNSNLYSVGYQQDGTDINIRVMKLNSNGASIWNRTYNLGVGTADVANATVVDSNSFIYIAATTAGVDWFIMKLDANGNSIWNRTYNPGLMDTARGMAIDKNNNIYVVGTEVASGSNAKWRIMKIDSNGVSLWNITSDLTSGIDIPYAAAIDKSNNLYVVGNENFGINSKWRIQKYDLAGNSLWNLTHIIPLLVHIPRAVTIDSSNNIYVAGIENNNNIRIAKFNPNGVSIWNITYNPTITAADRVFGIVIDKSNDIYVTGNENVNSIRISKLDNSLNYQSCGILAAGKSCTFDWQINGTTPGSYKVGVYVNNTFGVNSNVSENRTIIINPPDLDLNSITILPAGIVEPTINSNTTMNVTVGIFNRSAITSCTVRIYNSTNLVFTLSSSILTNPTKCFAAWNMDYWRNADTWDIIVNVTTANGSNNMISSSFIYNSLKASIIIPTTINFTGDPGQTVQSSNAFPLTIKNAGNEIYNISIKGTDYIGKTDNLFKIIVTNSTINQTSLGIFSPLTYSLQVLYIKAYPRYVKEIYFKTFIPQSIPSQNYEANVTISI